MAHMSLGEAWGILGVGFGKGNLIPYDNVTDELATQGVANRKLFTFVLNSMDSSSGMVTLQELLHALPCP